MIISLLSYQKAGDSKAFWKEVDFELGFEIGIRFIQTELRYVYVGNLGQELEKMGIPGEVASCVNYKRCLMAWTWKHGVLGML